MLLARGKEEITNETVCQMFQERKNESYLPAILKKKIIPVREELLCQVPARI